MDSFLAWQVAHYSERLQMASSDEARTFLRDELHRLKSKLNDTSDPVPIVGYRLLHDTSKERLFHS